MKIKLLSLPYLVWMGIFIIVPLLMVAYFALTNDSGAFTLKNLADVGQYASVFVRSVGLSVIATVICLNMLKDGPLHEEG